MTMSGGTELNKGQTAKINRELWTTGILSLPGAVAAISIDLISDGALNNADAILNLWVIYNVINAAIYGFRMYNRGKTH